MEEAVSGVKGELATKIYGDDLKTLEEKADQIVDVMRTGQGHRGSGRLSRAGPAQPQFRLSTAQAAARYQINVADVQDAIQTAVGGNALTQVLQGEARYDLVLRYLPQYRNTREAIENIRLLSPSGERVSLAQLCNIQVARRRFGNLSRRQPALYRHQVQRPRPRPGQRRGRSHQKGQRAGASCRAAITSIGKANTKARSAPRPAC